jgi:hypothetical protein
VRMSATDHCCACFEVVPNSHRWAQRLRQSEGDKGSPHWVHCGLWQKWLEPDELKSFIERREAHVESWCGPCSASEGVGWLLSRCAHVGY